MFSWNSPSDGFTAADGFPGGLFQSLFSWNSPSDEKARELAMKIIEFQSLFSWNSPSDHRESHDLWHFHHVSILVFVELALGPFTISNCFPHFGVSILVFVELALGHYRADRLWTVNHRFNPCFRGTRPRTANLVKGQKADLSFNPCFRGTRPRTKKMEGSFGLVRMFQSLFSWNSPSDRSGHRRHRHDQAVSILVFVELALGLQHDGRLLMADFSFQSLFSWNSPSDPGLAEDR